MGKNDEYNANENYGAYQQNTWQAAPGAGVYPAYPPMEPKKSRKGLIIGLVCGIVVLLAAVTVLLILFLGKDDAPQIPIQVPDAAGTSQSGEGNTLFGEEKEAKTGAPVGEAAEATVEKPEEYPAEKPEEYPVEEEHSIALILDGNTLMDGSYNQMAWEACRELSWPVNYYASDWDTDSHKKAISRAVADGYDTILLPGYSFEEAVVQVAPTMPEVRFILLDDTSSMLSFYVQNPDLSNILCVSFQEADAGYLAGYAAVKLGYRNLGFLGGMAVPAVVRYGYGFIQGADAAAQELGLTDVTLRFAYANQFFGDADITAAMRDWYAQGTEVIFSCGGGICTSIAEAAAEYDGKIIGADTDFAEMGMADMAVTSACKDFDAAVRIVTKMIDEGSFQGGDLYLGAKESGLKLADSTWFGAGFTRSDYADLLAELASGKRKVSYEIACTPDAFANRITVLDLGNLK